jgi:hypothetical protein
MAALARLEQVAVVALAASQLICGLRNPLARYKIVPVRYIDTARANCQTDRVFERFSKAFPASQLGVGSLLLKDEE